MGGVSGETTGPDLAAGIEVRELADGQPLLGHVGDESVILVRSGDDLFAIGAHCTHYGGPLTEGLVVDGTVRCPWHHACFSLRTGEALGAPALNPVARWSVEVRDGRAFVEEKGEHPPLAARGRAAKGPDSVVIVGAGAAGSAAAEMLRREGYTGPVTVVDPDRAAPYDRPNLSKDYLAGNAPEEWIPLRPDGFYEENDIQRVPAAAEVIDPHGRTIRLAGGRTLEYGALLLATGATAIRLDLPGSQRSHVHTLRTLTDCRAIIDDAARARRALVVGGSFIGMEVAASLRARGLPVTVVAPEAVPFARLLGEELGHAIQKRHEGHGVEFRLGRRPTEIGDGTVRLDDGTALDADLVVIGVGVRPEVGLAEAAGLDVDDGVVVDAYLESSAAGIYAAGDVARYPDPRTGDRVRIEHWVVAQRQGQTAARNILGRREPFEAVPFFWTTQFDLALGYVGHADGWDEVRVDGDPSAGDCAVSYLRAGAELALATVGRDAASLAWEARMERGGIRSGGAG